MITIRDILNEKSQTIYSVTPETTVYQTLETMCAHNIGSVLVMENEKLYGIFTERDYMKKIILHNRSSKTTPVKDVMSPDPVCVTLSDTVDNGLAIVTKQHSRHLPVIENGKIIGMISIKDLVKKKISDLDATVKYLSDYISPTGYY